MKEKIKAMTDENGNGLAAEIKDSSEEIARLEAEYTEQVKTCTQIFLLIKEEEEYVRSVTNT